MYDIIVIGSGPAGATFARQAALRGFETLLLDKESFPRMKPCGGGVSIKALTELETPLPQDIIERYIFGAVLSYKTEDAIIGKSKEHVGITVLRSAFDHYLVQLAQNAGVVFLENATLKDLRVKGGIAIVQTTKGVFRSKYLVGADGSTGTTARLSGIRTKWNTNEFGLAFAAEYPTSPEIIEEKFYGGNFLQITFLDILNGYAWVFPKKDRLNIGIGGVISEKNRLLGKYRDFLNWFQKDRGILLDYIFPRGHIVPIGGISRDVASKNVVLIGDAAGFVDPFSGEGIYYAIKSAKIALNAILESEKKSSASSAGEIYQENCNEHILPPLKYALRASKWFARNQKKAFQILKYNPALALLFSKLATGTESYEETARYMKKRMPYFLFRHILGECGFLKTKRIVEEENSL